MAEKDTATCALWWWHRGNAGFSLYDTEEDAAQDALYMEDSGEAAVVGVQFADGRIIKADDWPALAVARVEYERRWQERSKVLAAKPPPIMRTITEPFGGATVKAEAGEIPDWLGGRPEQT
ncbi:hypothetical protein [Streptomyces sp.]|uniref:hypothetical protein n=1 Tax=Streptomyces sp. TaxID=1931 RepID=UPI002F934CA3